MERSKREPKRWTPKKRKIFRVLLVLSLLMFLLPCVSASATDSLVTINGDGMETVDIVIMLTIIGLIPSILVMMTCFTRIIIVLSFLRNALGLQQTPPNQVLIGIALFLSLFIMAPVISEINDTAYQPYKEEQITQDEFFERAQVPIKDFMLKQTKEEDLDMFMRLSNTELTEGQDVQDIPLTVVIPSFVTSELKRAFTIGFLIFIPFLIIDMIVSSALMSMGMIMLPPVMISLPFKLLLFVLVDGWGLLFKTLAVSFNF